MIRPRQSWRIVGALCIQNPTLLREVQIGFHLAPADEVGKALVNSFNFINQIVRKILSL